MVDDNELRATMEKDMGEKLWQTTREKYPILQQYEFNYAYKPEGVEPPGGMEFYPPEETDRPKQFPLGKPGVAVFDYRTTPEDIYGDIATHYLVKKDPKLIEMYNQFKSGMGPQSQEFLRELYREATDPNSGLRGQVETRPYEQWLDVSGMDQYLRGYLANQFNPNDFSKVYTPQQLQVLQQMKQYLGLK